MVSTEVKNTTHSFSLPGDGLVIQNYVLTRGKCSFWAMLHILKLEDVPAYAIWRVLTVLPEWVSHVSIEVLTDNHSSSSLFGWHNFTNPVYLTVDKAVNILIESRVPSIDFHFPRVSRDFHFSRVSRDFSFRDYYMVILFTRHFIHDDKLYKYITGQAPQQSHFSFHKQR